MVQYAGGGVNNGKYVNRDNAGNITYVDRANATIFVTNGSGEITIDNLELGNYLIEEAETIIGYKKLESPIGVTVTQKITAANEIRIPNTPLGALRIIKQDEVTRREINKRKICSAICRRRSK